MIKRILLPLDPAKSYKNAFKFAAQLAHLQKARITGLVVIDTPNIHKHIGMVPAGAGYYAKELEQNKLEKAGDEIKKLLADFRSMCEEHNIEYDEHQRQGIASTKILETAKFYDVLVIGTKLNFDMYNPEEAGESLEDLLDDSVTPLFAVPSSYEAPDHPDNKLKVTIAFDGSDPSTRAMQRFAQLNFEDFSEVTVIMSDDNKKFATHYLEDAELFLKSHGFQNVKTDYTDENINDYIKENYLENTDLFVLGAHSGGLLDFMTGSLTEFLLKEDKYNLFIGQ